MCVCLSVSYYDMVDAGLTHCELVEEQVNMSNVRGLANINN